MGKTNVQMAQEAFDADLRFELLVHIGTSCVDSDRAPDCLEDLFEDGPDEQSWQRIIKCDPDFSLVAKPGNDEVDYFEFSEFALRRRKLGFLGQAASPVKKYLKSGGGTFIGGWGYYRTTWLYAETFDRLWELALDWAKEMDEEDKANAGKNA